MAVISNDIDNEIEFHLRNYKQYKKQLQEAKEEILEGTSRPDPNSRSSPSVSDITGMKGAKLVAIDESYMAKWVDVIESFINAKRYPEDWIRLVYYGYFKDQSYICVCQEMNIAERVYYELRGKVLSTLYTMAMERNIEICAKISLFSGV